MAEPHARGDLEHARASGRLGCISAKPEYLRGAPKECGVPDSVGRREQQELSRSLGQRGYATTVVVLDLRRNIHGVGEGEAACDPRRTKTTRELQQSQWVAARLSHDAVKDALVEPTVDRGLEQGARVILGESFQSQLG